jgi:hypothetical protein
MSMLLGLVTAYSTCAVTFEFSERNQTLSNSGSCTSFAIVSISVFLEREVSIKMVIHNDINMSTSKTNYKI